ncbi:uncharacterized protein KGF55_003049 [Candida pseudojiufengensis]|uniref:uncharacterized protein n=1 Tax=Candida pseudojiufengensis TaxID=497109 RepID=UPI002225B4DD|nr:uncharacterized protein KGF55_003049 [Candida pseudojiufengensis]KAI5963257.1 hypothetical protein KGF55_003049 [Candida pseudojiufengensis]
MVRHNREILTGGKNYAQKQSKKHAVNEVVFDKESRQEYLTGFHKRKLQRQKKAQEYNKEQERLAKIEERKQMRDERKQNLETQLKEFNEKAKEIAMINGDLKSDDDDEVLNGKEDEDEWTGFDEDDENEEGRDTNVQIEEEPIPLKGILHHKEVYEQNEELPNEFGDETTVTIESINHPIIDNNEILEAKAKSNNVNLNKSNEILEKSIERAKNYAVLCGVSKPSKDKKPKKKFRYLSKAERRENTRKEKSKSKFKGKK